MSSIETQTPHTAGTASSASAACGVQQAGWNMVKLERRMRGMLQLGAAVVALGLLAGCANAQAEPTAIPASIVRPEQPTPSYAGTLPQFRLAEATRAPVFVPTRDANAAATIAAQQVSGPSRRSLLQALLMNQPPSATGIAPGGATILDAPGGSAVGSVPGAGTVTVTGRSADGRWLAIYTDDGIAGWVSAGALVLYGDDDLTTVDSAFSPGPVSTLIAEAMQPVSTPLADMMALLPTMEANSAARATAIAVGGRSAYLAPGTPEPPAPRTTDEPGAAPDVQDVQIGTVNTTGNLNLRDRPATTATIVASLPPQSQLIVLGRTEQSDWLRVRAPGGDGWVDARFIDLLSAVDGLPVVE